jgi:hypothetical protein
MPKTLEGPITGRVDPGQGERRSQINAVLLIADRGFN